MRREVSSVLTLLMLAASADAFAYEVKPVERGGSISGTVRLHGKKPEARKLTVTKDLPICGAAPREVDLVEVGKSGELAGAVVYLEGVGAGKAWPEPPKDGFLVDQKGCRFQLAARVVPAGAKLAVRNSDPTLHNIHAQEVAGAVRSTLFNIAQPVQGAVQQQALKPRRGHAIKLECNVHDFMHAWLFAADTPYYAVTGADGRFELGEVPPGTYKLVVWHPVLPGLEASVEVGASARVVKDLVLER